MCQSDCHLLQPSARRKVLSKNMFLLRIFVPSRSHTKLQAGFNILTPSLLRSCCSLWPPVPVFHTAVYYFDQYPPFPLLSLPLSLPPKLTWHTTHPLPESLHVHTPPSRGKGIPFGILSESLNSNVGTCKGWVSNNSGKSWHWAESLRVNINWVQMEKAKPNRKKTFFLS